MSEYFRVAFEDGEIENELRELSNVEWFVSGFEEYPKTISWLNRLTIWHEKLSSSAMLYVLILIWKVYDTMLRLLNQKQKPKPKRNRATIVKAKRPGK